MDRKLFKNIIISTFFFGNSLLGTETRERETESASQEEQAQKTLNDELLQAIALGDATHLKDLLEKGANPNQIIFLFDKKSGEFHSTTPLIHAITSGNTDIVEILLANGANADQADDHGTTPLHAAMNICRPDDIKKVELLLQEMPNPNARDADSCTPLMLLVARIIELTRLSREENEKKTHNSRSLSKYILLF
jgi:ankyrin repeat protein